MKLRACAISCLVFFIACGKKEDGPKEVMVHGQVLHHERPIPNAEVWVKSKTNSFPGKEKSIYDINIKVDGEGEFETMLEPGDHYIYSIGYDEAIRDSVFGGIPVTVSDDHSEMQVDIPVTE